jgi:hypothetical protein
MGVFYSACGPFFSRLCGLMGSGVRPEPSFRRNLSAVFGLGGRSEGDGLGVGERRLS